VKGVGNRFATNGKTLGVVLYEELLELQINHGNPKIIFLSHMSRPILRLLYAALKCGFVLAMVGRFHPFIGHEGP
jgi:hypothetical protein